MAYLKTRRHPASTPWGYQFPNGDEVVEVADEHAVELLRISGGEFYEVLPGHPEHPDYQPATELDPDALGTNPSDPEHPDYALPAPHADASAEATAGPAAPEEPAGDPATEPPGQPERTPIAEPDPDQYSGDPADSPARTRTRTRQRTTE